MGLFARADPERDTAIMLGDPRKAIFKTVIPFLISLVIAQVNMIADVAWCSGLGSDSVSGIQAVNPLFWVIFDVGLGIGLGCNVIIARRIGAGDRDGAKRMIAQGMVLCIGIALALAPIIYLLISPMMQWMGAGELTEIGVMYLTPIIVCNVFQVLSPTLSGFLRGEGAATRSNIAMIVGTVANIIIDPILIYGLNMGVLGAGIATALCSVISTVVMIYFYLSHRTTIPMSFRGYRFDTGDVKEIMYLGAPKMTEMFLMDILDAMNRTFLIQCAGIDAITVFSVPFRLVIFAVMIPNSFALSLTPVASADLGAKRPDNSLAAYNVCLKYGITISIVLMIMEIVFAQYLILPFTLSDSMLSLEGAMADTLRVEAALIPAMGLAFISNAMLQSMRKPMLSLAVTFLRTGLTTLSFACLCGTTVPIMCVGMVAASVATAILAFCLTRMKINDLIRANSPSSS